jgi:hypothetical protein
LLSIFSVFQFQENILLNVNIQKIKNHIRINGIKPLLELSTNGKQANNEAKNKP